MHTSFLSSALNCVPWPIALNENSQEFLDVRNVPVSLQIQMKTISILRNYENNSKSHFLFVAVTELASNAPREVIMVKTET